MKRTFKDALEGKIESEQILLAARQSTYDRNVASGLYESEQQRKYALTSLQFDKRIIKILQAELKRIS